MTEIVLPIKCSTVKKIDGKIRILFLAMLGIYGGAALPAWIYWLKAFGYDGDIGWLNFTFICVSSIIFFVDLSIIIFNFEDIALVFPTITCIKDDEVKP